MMRRRITLIIMASVLLGIAACSSSQATTRLEDTLWRLQSYGQKGNLKDVLAGTEITATFDSGKKRVSGSSGVNTYSGNYQVSDGKLSILQLSWTEMYRSDPPGIMEQEQEYLNALNGADSFDIRNGRLEISSGSELLVYVEDGTGILQGIVSIGPISPVERPGETPTVPPEAYEARKIMVYDESGDELLQQVDIDDLGRYVTHLKPGTYKININHIGMDSSSDVPKLVQIQSGITTRVDISIDTGIR